MRDNEIKRNNMTFRRLLKYLDSKYIKKKTENGFDIIYISPKNQLNRLVFETKEGLDYDGKFGFSLKHTENYERPSNILKNILKYYKTISYQLFEPASFKDMLHYNFYNKQFTTTKKFELPKTITELIMKLDIIGV